ncbi:MAG TPA: twin-arginine translocase subunit TatC [Verrucomicrobiae bacterium]|nr:twin-arginine translocase subunit TatC [Verrucomicrobiae bacterium]
MASEQEGLPPDVETYPEEDGGGPVKTFLEHLEDLRWMLIKCVATVFVAMLICMIGGNYLVKILTWPLTEAEQLGLGRDPSIVVHFGTNVITRVPTNDLPAGLWGTNRPGSLQIMLKPTGSNYLVEVEPDPVPWKPPSRGIVNLVALGPLSAILVAMKLALYGGLILSAPFLLYFIGQFVLPALKLREKKLLYQIVSFGSALFFMGVTFCYFVIMAVALSATVQFSEWLGFGSSDWRAEDYISFACKFMLGMGLAFELPVVILTIVKIGLLDYVKLRKFRSYWIVVSLVVSAFITPSGDPVTMVLFAMPLWVLYEISVLIALYWDRRDRKREEAERQREQAARRPDSGGAQPRG